MKTIINHDSMRHANHLRVFNVIKGLGPVSRSRIQQESRLSWGSVTAITNDLLEKKIVTEAGTISTGVGRRPVHLDINSNTNFVLGIDLGATNLRIVVIDLKGRVINRMEEPTNTQEGKEKVLNQILNLVEKILGNSLIGKEHIMGMGIAVPGAVDAKKGICLFSPHLPGWENMPLKCILEEKLRFPVLIEHDPNCSALAEKWFGMAQKAQDVLCVTLGTGIGLGIIINGEVYRGVDGTAGEFGHITMDPDGPRCSCGNSGCLESYASGTSIAQRAIEAVRKNKESRIHSLSEGMEENITAKTVDDAAQEGDELAVKIFEEMGRYLGLGIAILINLFNPEFIVLSGRLSRAHKFFLPALEETIHQRTWRALQKEVKISQLGDQDVCLGASGIVLQEVFSGRLRLGSKM